MNYLRAAYSNELYHHGILGQKWGVRRYQNEDGSVTAAGARRYYDNAGTSTTREKKHLTSGQKKAIAIGVGALAAVGVGALAIHYGKQMKSAQTVVANIAKRTPLSTIEPKRIEVGRTVVNKVTDLHAPKKAIVTAAERVVAPTKSTVSNTPSKAIKTVAKTVSKSVPKLEINPKNIEPVDMNKLLSNATKLSEIKAMNYVSGGEEYTMELLSKVSKMAKYA